MCLQIFIPLPDCKEETFCLFAEDEHGVAISMTKEGITPQEVIDKYDGIIRKSFLILEFHSTIIQNFG
jgi:methionyl-tRNA synthetase